MSTFDITKTYLRKATLSDMQYIYEWANEDETRKNSFSSDKISWDTHVQWFENKLADTNSYIFILTDNSNLLGSIRLDYDLHSSFIISYCIDSKYRGLGLGTRIIHLADCEAQKIHIVHPEIIYITGKVKPSNIRSQKCFENNFYSLIDNSHNELTYQKVL